MAASALPVSAPGAPLRRPRYLAAALVLAALVAAGPILWMGSPARADVRVGYIDSSRIWIEFKDAQEAQQRFERQVQGWRDEAAEKEKTVNQLKADVRDQSPVLSALKRQEKESALTKAISDYETFI